METFQLRRSNITPAGHSSGYRLREGKGRVQKQRNFPKLASDSSSWSSDTTEENLFTCELGWKSSKQAVGTPMKKLLAEEMSRETESKRRSPSVIARLMGLDGLPPQQPSHKQLKKSSENYVRRAVSMEKARRSGATSHGRRSSRKSSKEEQEFKDVFEVLDASKMENSSYSSQGTANSKLTEAEMAFIEQKFMNAKRLSTNEKLQNSKEFHDTIEDLDCNKDLLLKFLQQPDSLFTKHLHDLQGFPLQSPCANTYLSAMNSSPQYESSGLGCKLERDRCKNRRNPHDDLFRHSYSKDVAHNALKSSTNQLEAKGESTVLPTRIVVLKPNLGRVPSATKTVSSPSASHNFLLNCRKHTELPGIQNRDTELCGKKKFPDDAGPSRYKSRESREIAKEITWQMRNNFTSGSMNFSTCGFKGYAGDESSSNRSENESANESEETTVPSRNSIVWSNRYGPSTSCSAESSVSREARRRLSERWKTTHKSVDMGVISRSSTLGEMLAIPDREIRPENSDVMIGEKVFSEKFEGNDGMAGWVEPLGISSSDGWKDGCIRNLKRSRSVPASSTTVGSPKTGMHCKRLVNDKYLMPKQVMQLERKKAVKGNFNQRKGSSSRNSRSSTKVSHVSSCTYSDHSDASPEIFFRQNQVQSNVTEDIPFKQNHAASATSAGTVIDTSLVPDNVVDVAIENMVMPSEPTDQESSAYMLAKGDSSTSDLEVLSSQEPLNVPPENGSIPMQCPVAELESPARSKEADQPSPVSVLETPFPDDLSSGSECFESLSADLHGLRMQLQLLKLESEADTEGPMLMSSDEDVEEGLVGFSEDRGMAPESREFSYIADAILDSGINDADPDTFMSTWYCPECPINSLVFEELEKKYSNHASWPRSERRLLFDRINLALLMNYQQFTDPHPWVRPATRVGPTWIKNGLKDGLQKFLASQDKRANNDTAAGKVLARESEWLDMGDDIVVIGREIEKLLTDELVNELVAM